MQIDVFQNISKIIERDSKSTTNSVLNDFFTKQNY